MSAREWSDDAALEAYFALVPSGHAAATQDAVALGCVILTLRADLAEDEALRDTMRDILTRTANALKGEPDPLHSHSWHDLPERAVEQQCERDALRAKAERMEKVVSAAQAWLTDLEIGAEDALADAVRSYNAAEGK